MRHIRSILSEADKYRSLIQEAYDAGRADGHREAADEFKAKISAILGESPAEQTHVVNGASPPAPGERQAQGTVKPTVLRLIASSRQGLTTDEIRTQTGFKPNSVRGTLWTLQKERQISRVGNRWVARRNNEAPADESAGAS